MSISVTARKSIAISVFLTAVLLGAVACTPPSVPITPTAPSPPVVSSPSTPSLSYFLPQKGSWELPADRPTGGRPSNQGTISIEGLGEFAFDPSEIETIRPDIFAEGHFSVFDVVAHLGSREWYQFIYHYNPCLDTFVIDELDGRMNWWYRIYTPGGWSEINSSRMDMLPYRDGMFIRLSTHPEEYIGEIYSSFSEELLRKSVNLGRVIIPEVRIGTVVHQNVPVSAHDCRSDVLQPGTITALDVLLSLADQKRVNQLKLSWYPALDDLDPFDSYVVEQIDDGDGVYDGEASPDVGWWVYETGALEFSGFKGSHTRVPADVRVIVSPEYMTWYWLGTPSR